MDVDSIALDMARRVADSLEGREFPGGRTQLQAAIQAALVAYLEDAQRPLTPALAPSGRYRHKIRGTRYTLLSDRVTLQTTATPRDGQTMCLFVADDGSLHVRSLAEFTDGRFEELGCDAASQPT